MAHKTPFSRIRTVGDKQLQIALTNHQHWLNILVTQWVFYRKWRWVRLFYHVGLVATMAYTAFTLFKAVR